MFPRNILTILKVSSFLCVLATKMVYATNGTHLRHSLLRLFIILKVTVSRDRSYTLCHVIRCPKWPLLEDDLTIHT
jgi:hypothetical protein